MKKIIALAACVALTLGGCATAPVETQRQWSDDIELALRTAPDSLKRQADDGDRHAMMAYAIVLRYGLHGVARDGATADHYVNRATQGKVVRTSLQFVRTGPGPAQGYVAANNTYAYPYSPAQASAVEACAAIVAAEGDPAYLDAKMERGLCGGIENYRRLKAMGHRN